MTSVILYQPEETFELLLICWKRSLDDCLNLFRVRSKVIAAEDVSEVLDRGLNKDIFLTLEFHSCLTQGLENKSEYTKMIVQV